MGDASKVVPIDKLSVVITLVLAFIVLHEEFTTKSVIGCILIGAGTLLMVLQHFQFKGGDLEMYAQAIRTPPVYRHRRANNQAHLNMFKGCAFSNEPCDCIKSLKLGDPCCGSGGMSIQSAALVKAKRGDISRINVYGQEKDAATYRLAKMNLAVLTGSN